MARVVFASASRQTSTIVVRDWLLADGPLHLGLAHYLLGHRSEPFVIISRGLLAGRPVVGAQVASVTAVSPQSGGIAEAEIEGPIADALFRLGLDAIVVTGVAQETLGLDISGPSDQLRVKWELSRAAKDATVWSADARVRSSPGDVVLTTGRLGMAGHQAASIVANNGFPTTQGGLGAVLGHHNLKYIWCHGLDHPAEMTERERSITEDYEAAIEANPLTKSEKDLPGFAFWPTEKLVGYVGSDGFSGAAGPGLSLFSAQSFSDFATDDGALACPHCPQACLKSFATDAGAPLDGGRAHQLGVSARASQSNETDAAALIAFNARCHELGVEHLSADEALRLYQPDTTDDPAAVLEKALETFPDGVGSAMRVKGMALPPFDPRANQGLAVGLALNPTGPRYDVLEHDIDFEAGQPWLTRDGLEADFGVIPEGLPMGTLDHRRHQSIVSLWQTWSALDALGICEYAAPPARELTISGICSLVTDATGESFDSSDLVALGTLRLGILRDINATLGMTHSQDTLPQIFFDAPLPEGPLSGASIDRVEFGVACDFVREKFDWSPDGVLEGSKMRGQIDDVIAHAENIWEGVLL